MTELRVAVVGAGPAGCYIVDSLLNAALGDGTDVRVDLFDRLPTPFGLLRYGVAPDHPRMKSLTSTLQQVLDQDRVRFFGNVHVGTDVTIEELRGHYHAVVYAFGAAVDRRLEIPGEDLPGSCSATQFVAWYSGHPDVTAPPATLTHPAAVVVGAGNVAVDVARILSRPAGELAETDIPDEVLAALSESGITDVHVLARRGPAEAKFTYKELRELGELTDVDVIVDPADLDGADAIGTENPAAARNLATMREWASRPAGQASRRLHLHFHTRPVEIQGGDEVVAVVLERGRDERTSTTLPIGLILRAVGYRGMALDGVPFDDERGVVPTDAGGRVVRNGSASVGEYAAGWIKRGPRGVLGTNRADADETVTTLVTDLDVLLARPVVEEDLLDRLRVRGATVLDKDAWSRIDSAEVAAGEARGCQRQKLPTREALLEAGLGVAAL